MVIRLKTDTDAATFQFLIPFLRRFYQRRFKTRMEKEKENHTIY